MKFKILIIISCFLVCCTDKDELRSNGGEPAKATDEISFNVGAISRGSEVIDEEDMVSVGMYCSYTVREDWDPTNTNHTFTKMENGKFEYSSSTSSWEWTDSRTQPHWGFSSAIDKYTFFAYSPYSATGSGIDADIVGNKVEVNYTVPTTCADQKDLTVAIPRKNIFPQTNGKVPLTFVHPLSHITFSVNGNPDMKIVAIEFQDIISSGKLLFEEEDGNCFKWTDTITTADFKVNVSDDDIKDVNPDYDHTVTTNITKDDGHLFMIPQRFDEDKIVKVTVKKKDLNDLSGTTYLSEETFEVKLPKDSVWEAGKHYNYIIGLYTQTELLDANCYMLHPSDGISDYYIPIDGRINEFWGNRGYYYEPENTITKDDVKDLTTEIVWYDCDAAPSNLTFTFDTADTKANTFINKKVTSADIVGLGGDFRYRYSQVSLKVSGINDTNEGNIVVSVKKEGRVLWTWHLWVTEYNPDKIAEANKTSIVYGTFDYVATGLGGSVHRYQDCEVFEDSELTVDGDVMVEDKKYKNHVRNGSNNIWQSGGIYDGKFIMDRNLGAVDTLYPVANPDILGMEPFLGKGAVYYQFGRNTPFPGRSAMGGNNSAYLFSTAFNADAPTMKARVLNPITFYKASGWVDLCTIDFNGTDYLWNDFKAKITNTTGGTTGRQKSIFDPSPLGWRLPINGTWSDFGQLTAINRWRTSQSLISYGDTGATNLVKGTGGTFYPGSNSYWLLGTRYQNSTATVSAGYSWSASPSLTTSQGYHLHFSYSDANGEHNMNPSHSSARSFGFPVRPVQE